MAALPILLLPGMHGSGDLFDPFVREAPPGFRPIVVSLPQSGSYEELMRTIRPLIPKEPFVMLGESYSGPLALRLGSERSAPAIVLRGSEDAVVPERAVKKMEGIAPRVVRKDIAGPHLLLQTAPREAWAAITEFLRAASLHPAVTRQ